MDLSLFFFADNTDERGSRKYRLVLEGARYGDRNGLAAVWTPERHFHQFGGQFPNPAVLAAGIATTTSRIRIRAGSVVLPLHDPIRIAEDWALVDNLSDGRVGVSFASGWAVNDFILEPVHYPERHAVTHRGVETVRKLWRGDPITRLGPHGQEVTVGTLPRPVQAELPIWLTAGGHSMTFKKAGELGTNVLTHLLGQSWERLHDNIQIYRQAWKAAGHAGRGSVSLMVHTYVDEDPRRIQELAKPALCQYLQSSAELTDLNMLRAQVSVTNANDVRELAMLKVERYVGRYGLIGSRAECQARVSAIGSIGIDEIACLIDFGVPVERALDSLRLVATLASQTPIAVDY